MKYKAVIFDMDGLMVDTEIVEHRSLERIVKEEGKEPKVYETGLIHEAGKAGHAYYEHFKNRHDLNQDIDTIKNKKRLFFEQILASEELVPFAGLLDLLDILKKEKFKIALASNRNEKVINIVLDKLNIKDQFDLIVGPGDNRAHKPAPDIYLHTVKELKLRPEDCIVLEDSEVGIISGKAAGMKVIAVPNQYTKDHDFSKADKVVFSLKEINLNLINSL